LHLLRRFASNGESGELTLGQIETESRNRVRRPIRWLGCCNLSAHGSVHTALRAQARRMLFAMKTIERILVPIDFSPAVQVILEYAHLVAKPAAAAITLLNVYEPPPVMGGIVPGADNQRDQLDERTRAGALLTPMLNRLQQLGVAQTAMIVEPGFAGDTILRVASEGKFDLIIMGTRGRTPLNRLIMGSVTEEVLRKSPCPVITVHIPGQ
jgi:universal stress protein A